MPVVSFDTLKLAQTLKSSGFTQKQAIGAAEALSEALAESYTSKLATTEAVETLGRAVEKRITSLESKIDQRFDEVGRRINSLEDGQSKIVGLMEKLLEGQAVLHQNDMELKRRLDERKG